MKKLISITLVLALSLCFFCATSCFADGSEPKTQEVKAELVIDQKIDASTTEKYFEKIDKQIQPETKLQNFTRGLQEFLALGSIVIIYYTLKICYSIPFLRPAIDAALKPMFNRWIVA
ncbi:MAG: hypothetical protein RUMPE_00841 [Eubacteriales bacterium SKADARSKE-1]|nr:hypothetical protein [Eubacteriales bacterium SKADARSKE-1]